MLDQLYRAKKRISIPLIDKDRYGDMDDESTFHTNNWFEEEDPKEENTLDQSRSDQRQREDNLDTKTVDIEDGPRYN